MKVSDDDLAMICTCSIDGLREAERMRLAAMKGLGIADPSTVTTAVILSLAFDFAADAGVYVDQWCAVDLRTPLCETGLFLQCDDVDVGLMRLWLLLAEAHPERRSARGSGSESDAAAASARSDALVAAVAANRETRAAHYKQAHAGTCAMGCDTCKEGFEAYGRAYRAVRAAWGGDVVDSEIERVMREDERSRKERSPVSPTKPGT